MLEENNQHSHGAQQNAHNPGLIFFEGAQFHLLDPDESEPGKDDHASNGGDREDESEQGKPIPAVTDTRDVNRHKRFAGRKGEEREQAGDGGDIGF